MNDMRILRGENVILPLLTYGYQARNVALWQSTCLAMYESLGLILASRKIKQSILEKIAAFTPTSPLKGLQERVFWSLL